MTRYLLFDAGCPSCTGIAGRLEAESNGWLIAKSLTDANMQALLDQACPTWQWQPTLLELDGASIQVNTGWQLTLRLAKGLGVRKSLRIVRALGEAARKPSAIDEGRRAFLKRAPTLAIGLSLLPSLLESKPSRAQSNSTAGHESSVPPEPITGPEAEYFISQALTSTEVALLGVAAELGSDRAIVQRFLYMDRHSKHRVFLPLNSDEGYVFYTLEEDAFDKEQINASAMLYIYDETPVADGAVGVITRYANLAAFSTNGELRSLPPQNDRESVEQCTPVDQSSCDACPNNWGIQFVERSCCKTRVCNPPWSQNCYDVYCCCVEVRRGPCLPYC